MKKNLFGTLTVIGPIKNCSNIGYRATRDELCQTPLFGIFRPTSFNVLCSNCQPQVIEIKKTKSNCHAKGPVTCLNASIYLYTMVSSYFSYNKPKVIQALRYHFISRKEIKILMVMVNIFAILTALLFFFKKISPLAFLISSLLWFILMILFWFLLPNIIYRRASTFKDSFRAILTATDFTIENNRGRRSWEWLSFSGWMESPHFFHLYFNTTSFFIVPKEAFEGDELHEARKILKTKVKKL